MIIIIIIINQYLDIFRSFTIANEDQTQYHNDSRSDDLLYNKLLHTLILRTNEKLELILHDLVLF